FTVGATGSVLSNLSGAGGAITVSADTMSIAGPVKSGSAMVSLAPVTAGGPIDLGTNPSAGKLGLAQTDLNNVSAGMLRVGNASAGGITVSAPVTLTSTNTLSLITGNGISQTAPLSVLNLALQAAAGITLADANNAVTNLAFNNTAGAVQFTNTGSLTIAAVRSEEHTSELQSRGHLVCRLLLE